MGLAWLWVSETVGQMGRCELSKRRGGWQVEAG